MGNFVNPDKLINFEKKNPAYDPKNREGAKFPPFPPLPSVIPVAKTFNNMVAPTNSNSIQLLFLKSLNKVFSNSCPGSFSDKVLMLSYPSPNKVGKTKIIIANKRAPNSPFL